MTWDRFEALAAILYERQGRNVMITPRTGDEGIDVLAGRQNQLEVIQCKHTGSDATIDADVIAELLQTFDGFRSRRLRMMRGCNIQPVVVTNGKLTKRALAEARQRDVTIVDTGTIAQLLKRFPCTAAEIEVMNLTRIRTMAALAAKLDALITPS
jgi:HJR/Mrr/RecB family endonuclease